MGTREFVRKNGVGLAVVLLLGAGAVIYFSVHGNGYHPPKNAYFVDEETGEELIRPATDIPPLLGKSGKPTVVREFKYSVDGGKTVKTGYYFKFNDATKKKIEDSIANGGDVDANPGELVRSPIPGSKWVSLGSDEAQSIVHPNIPPNANVRIISP